MYLVAFNYNFFCKGVPSLLVWLVRKARLFEPVNLLKKILKNLPRYSFQLLKLVFIIKIAPYYILLVYLVRVLGLLEEEAQEFLRRRSFIGTIAYVVRLVANDFDRLCEKLTSSKLFVKYPLQLLKLAFVIKITPYCVFFFYLVRVLGLLEEEAQEFLRRKSFIGTIMYVARLVANNFDRLWRDACLAANNFDRLWEKLTPSKLFVKYSFQLLKLAFVIKITPYCVFFFYLVRVLGLLEEEG
jgi:HJR/Mrr/RecB family endonuclease